MVSAKEDLTIGLLSWKAHQTLEKTLASYAEAGLTSLAARSFIFFNSITDEDRAIAAKYGWEALGSERNLGIWGGMDAIAAEAKTDYVLFLQNDCPIVTMPECVETSICGALGLLESADADLVRLRHRFNQGDGINFAKFFDYYYVHELDSRATRYFDPKLPVDAFRDTLGRKLMRVFRPHARLRRLVSIVHLEAHPDAVAPRWIRKDGDFYIVDSAIINFSEQPLLISKRLYGELSAWSRKHSRHRSINGMPVMEHALNCRWWRNRHFKIGVCDEGVFTHARWDDSWRPGHAAFNAAILEERS